MRKHYCFSLLLALLLLITTGISAQSSVFRVGFESGIPASWSQDPTTVTTMWTSGSNGISVGTAELDAYEGSNYASLFATSSQSEVKLITDMVDASTLTAPILSYAIVQPSNSSGFVDSLRVYYRNSATDAWTLLVCDKTPTATWLRREVALTGVSLSSIQFAFEYNYANGRGVGLDDIYLGNMQTCVTPVFGATYQITDTSATLTWADDESHELGYSLKVSNAPITDFTQTALVEATSFFSPYTITGLSANTTYYCYVKARCSATDESEWSAATIFTTLCSPVNLPFSENFNSYTATTGLPSCWTSVMNFKQSEWGNVIPPANIYPSVETSTALGAAALRLTGDYFKTTDGVNRTTSSWYATPMINVANLSNTQISFWMNSASRGNHVEVGVMSDPTDIATFRVIADVTPMTANVWEEVIVPFDGVTESDYKFIAFLVEGSGYIEPNIFYIDDIVIEDIPACSKPSLIRSTVLGSDSVVLNWTAAKVSSWEIKVSTTQMSDLTVAADIYNGTVTSKPATIRNLTPATDYYVYIRSMCSPANSEWSNVYKFTTLCAPESVFPYVVDFTTMSIGTFPICWNRNGVGNFVPSIATFWNNDYTAQINSLYLNSDEAGVSYAVTPAINSTLNSLSLKMNISTRNMGFCGYLEIGSMTDPEDYTTFSAIDTLYLILDDLVEYNVSLERSTLPGLGNHIALRHSGVNSNFGYYITRLEIDSLPTCASAQNISLTSLTSTSAAIGWNADPSVLRWAVKVSKTNHANPESGAGDVYQDTISTTNFSLSGLAMGVNYYVFVKSICADETSYWQRYAITTPCSGIESFPFIETFSDYGNSSAYPTCWNRGGTSGNLSLIHNTYELTFTPTTSEYNYNPVLYAVLPQLVATGVNVNDLMISLNYKVSSVSAPLEIGVMTSVLDTASFVTVATLNVTAANNYEYFAEVSLDSYTGTGKYIAVRSRVPEGMYSVTARIDDVRIDLIPTCSRILSTEVVGFGEDYINFSWEQRSEEALWDVVIGPKGFNPDEATAIAVSTAAYRFSNLTPNTEYDIYVRANCGNVDGVSIWSDVVSTKTTTLPTIAPYYTDFTDADDNSEWLLLNHTYTNKFVIGSGANVSDGTNALYISSGTGDNPANTYATNATSYVYATRNLRFYPGAYKISFNWVGVAEGNYDNTRVYLVKPEIAIVEGVNTGLTGTSSSVPAGWDINIGSPTLMGASTWQRVEQNVVFADTTNYNLVIFWKNDNTDGSQPPFALSHFSIEEVECLDADGITASYNDTSATISWNYFDKIPKYDVIVSENPVNVTDLDNTASYIFNDTVNTNSVSVSGLTASTTYYVYVRSNCNDGSVMSWMSYLFTTDCDGIQYLPYTTGLEEFNSFPNCWYKPTTHSSYPMFSTSENNTFNGSKSIGLGYSPYTGGNTPSFALPRIDADDISNLVLTYEMQYQSRNQKLEIGVMTNPRDISTFHSIKVVDYTEAKVWVKDTVTFDNYRGEGRYIAFRIPEVNTSYYIYVDNIDIRDRRACQTPANIYVSNLSETGARIAWSHVEENVSKYNVKVSSTPINPEIEDGDIYEDFDVQSSFVNILGSLQPATTYYYYVQTNCDDNTINSYWSSEASFKTLCQSVDLAYEEDFETATIASSPECWYVAQELIGSINRNYYPSIQNVTKNGEQTKTLRMDSYYNEELIEGYQVASGAIGFAVLPYFADSIKNMYIQFDNYSPTTGAKLKVGIVTNPSEPSTFVMIDEVTLGAWQQNSVSLANYTDEDFGFIAFVFDGIANQTTASVFIDNVKVDYMSACREASALWTENVTTNTADIIWKPLTSTDSVWRVQVCHFDAGNDVDQLDDVTDFVIDTIVTGSQFTARGLISQTTYYYYVRPVCEDGEGPRFSTSKSFRTACDLIALPYTENFDSYSAGSGIIPECWLSYTDFESYDNTVYPCIVSNRYRSASRGLDFSSNAGRTSYVALPLFDIADMRDLAINFYGRGVYGGDVIEVGIAVDPYDLSTYEAMETFTVEYGTWTECNYSFCDYEGEGRYVIIRSYNSSGVNFFAIDDLRVYEEGACAAPETLKAMNISKTDAILSWNASSIENTWDIAYGVAGTSFEDLTTVTVTNTMYSLAGLSEDTQYSVYIRSICSATQTSSWYGPVTFRTLKSGATIPFTSTFEDATEGWILVNGTQANNFFIGNATNNGGLGALYVSGDNGLTNDYVTTESVVYAYCPLELQPGRYDISYDWKAQGYSIYNYWWDEYVSLDYGRAYIAPKSLVLNAGVSNFDDYSIPNGAISIDNFSVLMSQNQWTTVNTSVTINSGDTYYLVFAWNNSDYGDETIQPALSIDNVSVTMASCFDPKITVDSITSTSAYVMWNYGGDSAQVRVSTTMLDFETDANAQGDIYNSVGATTVNYLSLTALTENTTYYVYVKGYCSDNESTDWNNISFTTYCSAYTVDANNIFSENFDSYADYTTAITCWITGSENIFVSNPTVRANNSSSAPNSLYMSGNSDGASYAITPILEGTAVNNMLVSFKARPTYSGYKMRVGAMTNPNDISTFVEIQEVAFATANIWYDVNVDMSRYAGTGKHIAFLVGGTTGSYIYLDDIVIEPLPSCKAPQSVLISRLSGNSFTASWSSDAQDSEWRLKVTSAETVVLDTVVYTTTFDVSRINPSTTYEIMVQNICGANDTSAWSASASATTRCGEIYLPMLEEFNNGLPTCWTTAAGYIDDVLAGTDKLETTNSSWRYNSANGLTGAHMSYNTWSSGDRYWMITPSLNITSGAVLSFDLAVTAAGSNNAPADHNGFEDDRFIVVVSTDGGNTWDSTSQVIWSEDIAAQYRLLAVPNAGQKYYINLSQYMGQEIMIGFYIESTASNNSYTGIDVHLDNVAIDLIDPTYVSADVCQGYAYSGNDFEVDASETQEPGMHLFTRPEGNDQFIVLQLTVTPSALYTYNDTICEGDSYNSNGFNNLTVAGTYDYNVARAGQCDSIVRVALYVTPTIAGTDNITLCDNELPYMWRGNAYTQSGTYTETEKISGGCDREYVLNLRVNEVTHIFDSVMIRPTDLPYVYNDTVFTVETPEGTYDYVFKYRSVTGCDSIHHLNLVVDTKVDIADVQVNFFELYPNPINRYGEVTLNANFTETELSNGLTVEVFNAVGECVNTIRPTALPILIDGFDASGVYIVRVTTSENRIEYGKVVVR